MNISQNYTEQVARFVVETRMDTIPGDVIAAAKTAILDCLGVALAGSTEEATRICAEQVLTEGAPWLSMPRFNVRLQDLIALLKAVPRS